MSPDGKAVYALASVADSLIRFERDGKTGRLRMVESHPVGDFHEPGSAGLAFSPDGRHVYVADEDGAAVVVFERSGL